MEIIENIKKIRANKGISHEAMAANLGMSQAAYTKLERKETKLTVDRLYDIAKILEVKVEDLMNFKQGSFRQDIYNNETVTAYRNNKLKIYIKKAKIFTKNS